MTALYLVFNLFCPTISDIFKALELLWLCVRIAKVDSSHIAQTLAGKLHQPKSPKYARIHRNNPPPKSQQ